MSVRVSWIDAALRASPEFNWRGVEIRGGGRSLLRSRLHPLFFAATVAARAAEMLVFFFFFFFFFFFVGGCWARAERR